MDIFDQRSDNILPDQINDNGSPAPIQQQSYFNSQPQLRLTPVRNWLTRMRQHSASFCGQRGASRKRLWRYKSRRLSGSGREEQKLDEEEGTGGDG